MTRFAPALLLAAALLLPAGAATNSPALTLAQQLNNAFVEVAESVSASVVVIRVVQKQGTAALNDDDNPLWYLVPPELRKQYEEERRKEAEEDAKRPRKREFNGKGSGMIVRDDGYILTNFHVVEDAEEIQVRLRDGRRFTATLQGKDPQSDLAVLKINATNLPAARLGNSDAVRVGEFAVAIGAPFEFDYSVTFGHISAKGRSQVVPSSDPYSQGASMDQDFLQTDASINPGNSGGPLVNLQGEVIGINTLIRGLRSGIGFAVPVNLAKEVSETLIRDGKFPRSWLGIGIRGLRESDDEPEEKIDGAEDGVLVTDIRADGPARNSDLKPRDVITAVDGRRVVTAAQLRNEVRRKKPGTAVTLDVIRQAKPLKIKVHPEDWPETKPAKDRNE